MPSSLPPLSVQALRFTDEYVTRYLGQGPAKDLLDGDTRARIFRLLSRKEEVEEPRIDQWGNWMWPGPEDDGRRVREAVVDRIIQDAVRKRSGTPPPPPSRWPGTAPFALCLTHDVDILHKYNRELSPVMEGLGRVFRGDDRLRVAARTAKLAAEWMATRVGPLAGPDPLWRMDEWADLEDRFGFRASYFFVPERLSRAHFYDMTYRYSDRLRYRGRTLRVRDMMRELGTAGFDVGLHGSYFSYVDAGVLREQKSQIERCIEAEVTTTRQHYLHFDAVRTPRAQAAAGLRCDSTQGFNTSIGYRAGASLPYFCWDHEDEHPLPLLEVPMILQDVAFFEPGTMELSLDAVEHEIHLAMDEAERHGGCLTVNWHPNRIDDDRYWTSYRLLLEEGRRRGAWGCSMKQVHEWWTSSSKPEIE